jgi:hypothetical protein
MISLEEIYQNNDNYNILLTSWTSPIFEIAEMHKLMSEGSTYLYKVDHCVKNNYSKPVVSIDACENTLKELELPLFLATTVVDNAFKSHLFFLN